MYIRVRLWYLGHDYTESIIYLYTGIYGIWVITLLLTESPGFVGGFSYRWLPLANWWLLTLQCDTVISIHIRHILLHYLSLLLAHARPEGRSEGTCPNRSSFILFYNSNLHSSFLMSVWHSRLTFLHAESLVESAQDFRNPLWRPSCICLAPHIASLTGCELFACFNVPHDHPQVQNTAAFSLQMFDKCSIEHGWSRNDSIVPGKHDAHSCLAQFTVVYGGCLRQLASASP